MNLEHDQLETTDRLGLVAGPSHGVDAGKALRSGSGCHRLLSDDVLQHAEELVLKGSTMASPINGWGTLGADPNTSQGRLASNDRPGQDDTLPAVLKPLRVSLFTVGAGTLLAYAVFSAIAVFSAYAAVAAYATRKSHTKPNSQSPRTSRAEQQRR